MNKTMTALTAAAFDAITGALTTICHKEGCRECPLNIKQAPIQDLVNSLELLEGNRCASAIIRRLLSEHYCDENGMSECQREIKWLNDLAGKAEIASQDYKSLFEIWANFDGDESPEGVKAECWELVSIDEVSFKAFARGLRRPPGFLRRIEWAGYLVRGGRASRICLTTGSAGWRTMDTRST